MPWLPRLRAGMANALLALASTAAVLAAVEGAARWSVARDHDPAALREPLLRHDPLLGWGKPPGASAVIRRPEYRVQLAVNSLGLRGPERSHARPEGVRRVLLLGDSFTEGYTVEEALSVRAELERLLNARGSTWEVVNGGTHGWSTDQELLFFQSEGVRYAPEAVVLLFYYNDLHGNLNREAAKPWFEMEDGRLALRNVPVAPPPPGSGRGLRRPSRLKPWRGSMALRLLTLRAAAGQPELHRALARWGLVEPNSTEVPAEMLPYGRRRPEQVAQMWSLGSALLGELKRQVEAAESRLLVFYVPARFEVNERAWDFTRRRYQMGNRWSRVRVGATLAAVCGRLGLPFVAAGADFRMAEESDPPAYYPQDGHWTPVGHAIAARAIAGAIIGSGRP